MHTTVWEPMSSPAHIEKWSLNEHSSFFFLSLPAGVSHFRFGESGTEMKPKGERPCWPHLGGSVSRLTTSMRVQEQISMREINLFFLPPTVAETHKDQEVHSMFFGGIKSYCSTFSENINSTINQRW